MVALEKPAAHEQGDNYLRRFLPHLPGPGEIVLLDRSWYNRAGVEHVLGFCQREDYDRFLQDAPGFERTLTGEGIDLIKLWFSVTRAEQLPPVHRPSARSGEAVEAEPGRSGVAE